MLKIQASRIGYRNGFEVKNVSLTVDNGEVLLLLGPSGSGKTTLARAVTRTIEIAGGFVEGSIILDGVDIYKIPLSEIYKKISYVPQEPWYGLLGHTVEAEIYSSLASAGQLPLEINTSILRVGELLTKMTYNLSAGESQRVLIYEAIARRASLIVMDEPFVYLDTEGKRESLAHIKEYLANGGKLLVIDHDPGNWATFKPVIGLFQNYTVKPLEKGDFPYSIDFTYHPRRKVRENTELLLEARNIWFRYPGEEYVFKDFSLQVPKGSLIGLVGRNGAGKTTLLKILAGILKPTKGDVVRKCIPIYVPENALLFLSKPTPRLELTSFNGLRLDIEDVAEIFSLKHLMDTPIGKLSSGERRRLSLAVAYLIGAECLLIDEPTGGLDPWNTKVVLESIETIVEEGRTVVVATHDERVTRISDQVVRIGG